MKKPRLVVDRRKTANVHGTHKPVRVVLHSTESHDQAGINDVVGVLKFLENTPDKLGIHFVVDKEGNIGQGATCLAIAYHCGGHNTGSIGIEMIGFARFSATQWYKRRKQLQKVAELLAWLHTRFGIELRYKKGVFLHRNLSGPGGHWDPGYGFPTRRVLRWARQMAKH